MRSVDDRTTLARIRDAAIAEFATNGVAATSIRSIAAAAGVSPGLVMHHFGSKDDLRVACDQHVAAVIRNVKGAAMSEGAAFDVAAAFRSQSGGPPAAKYLARTLVDGSPHVAELVDELVNDAAAYLEDGVASGMIKPSRHAYERAAVVTIWALGAVVLHEHLERLIGVDITADLGSDPRAVAPYAGPVLDVYGGGILTAAATEMMREALVGDQPSIEHEGEQPTTHREREPA